MGGTCAVLDWLLRNESLIKRHREGEKGMSPMGACTFSLLILIFKLSFFGENSISKQ